MRTSQPYLYYGETTSLCEECLSLVQAKIIFEGGNVFYLKHCLTHGFQKTLISTDIEYYKLCRESVGPSFPPESFNYKIDKGCPYDCGLCEAHEQHSCMAIIEIIDDCNMHCPTCIAGSFPGAGNRRTMEEVELMLDTIVEREGYPDVVMISGGEPTIHPNIIEILHLAKSKPIKHLMLITNGVRIATDKEFVEELRKIKTGLEIYLQFDSLQEESLLDIRGEDLREVRRNAVNNLEEAGIATTLICVTKKGVTDNEVGSIIDFALKFNCIRGVTFQPVKATGRNESFVKEKNYITLSEVRSNILRDSEVFKSAGLIPHPCNPENISIGYVLKKEGNLLPVNRLLFDESTTTNENEDLSFENTQGLKSMMYFLPDLDSNSVKYENLFRVTIVSILDHFNFCISAVKRSCIHFVTPLKEIIPLDTYYLLYAKRDDAQQLIPILRK
jgi:uncharacterized radical SAM superfamily Fe-S cluster-containing enzyme